MNRPPGSPSPPALEALRRALIDSEPATPAPERLERLIAAGLDRLPVPGGGATLQRWQSLAAVAASDLSLAKLYEGHTDALAIFDELGGPIDGADAPGSWAVWAAEAPQGRALIEPDNDARQGQVRLSGAKGWCSGAAGVKRALLTAWHADGRGPQLVSVEVMQPGVRVSAASWHAVGMVESASLDVVFDRARVRLVGEPGDYLRRPGFWHGGAGVAACWYGAGVAIAEALRRALEREANAAAGTVHQGFRRAALGRVDVSLRAAAALLREGANWIDANPRADASAVALRTRLCAEQTATAVLAEVGRALGATPFCRDARFARAAADLPVFIRQSHAERDLAALGERAVQAEATAWWL